RRARLVPHLSPPDRRPSGPRAIPLHHMREGGKSMAQPVVWRLADDDARAAAEVAARASQAAPLFADAVPDAAERAAFLPLFFVDAVHAAIASGGAWAIGDRAD